MRVRIHWLMALSLVAVVATPLRAQVAWQIGDQDWCDESAGGRDSAWACEVRIATLSAAGELDVDGGPNGGIEVEAWSGTQVEVEARVTARAPDEARADELLRSVDIAADGGRITADGARQERRESWSVSYRIRVPTATDLTLRTTNGGIDVTNVSGDIDFRATNGGVTLVGLAGDVRGRTTNGGLRIELAGSAWTGDGMDVETTNGGVTMLIPAGYSAVLEVGTTNGGIDIDFPVTIQGRLGRRALRTTLGDGGSPVRAVTTNGGVHVTRL